MPTTMKLLLIYTMVIVTTTQAYAYCTRPKITIPDSISGIQTYILRQNTSIEAYCSSDTNDLVFTKFLSEELHTYTVNDTTVKTIVEPQPSVWIECYGSPLLNSFLSSAGCFFQNKVVQIIFNFFPKITELECFSNHFELLNCSWRTNLIYGNYALSFDNKNIQRRNGGIDDRKYYIFLWDIRDIVEESELWTEKPLLLQLQVCNAFDCVTKNENIDLATVTKLNAPKILEARPGGPYAAILSWTIPLGQLKGLIQLYYKIEYSFPGMEQGVIISDTERVSRNRKITNHLKLPCPGKQYTVRVSFKLAKAPPGYMSDYAYSVVHTDFAADEPQDPICASTPVKLNPPVMVYKIQILRQEIVERIDKFKIFKKRLYEKAELIRKLHLSNY